LILVGVHAAGSRAFYPIALPGGSQELVAGSKAVATGVGFAVTLLIVGAFWGTLAWGMWTTNWAVLKPLTRINGVVVGVGAVVAVVSDLTKKLFRSRETRQPKARRETDDATG
jgi:succinate-acetate transporter protein